MKILFFPQNETHLQNMRDIARVLSGWGAKCTFLDGKEYFKQELYEKNFPYEIVRINRIQQGRAFYKAGAWEKVKLAKQFSQELCAQLGHIRFDTVVVGNDGALQRIALDVYNRADKHLLLDGVISDYRVGLVDVLATKCWSELVDFARRQLRWRLPKLLYLLPKPLARYMPSEIGSYRFDKAFVISPYVREFLRNTRGTPIKTIISVGLPRYESLALRRDEGRVSSDVPRVLFISQGFLWHNEIKQDETQHRELSNLLAEVRKLSFEVNVVVRVHPRDEASRYSGYGVEIERSSQELVDSVLASDLVVGLTSTVLLESRWLGVPTLCLMTSGNYWRFKRSFIGEAGFQKVFNLQELSASLNQLLSGHNSESARKGRSEPDYLFRPFRDDTKTAIAKEIVDTGGVIS